MTGSFALPNSGSVGSGRDFDVEKTGSTSLPMRSAIPWRHWVALDRDGTLIRERHYLSEPDQVELIPGAAEGLRALQETGLGLVMITNQSGIGRGYFDTARLDVIHQRVGQLLGSERVHLDGVYFCPHIPEDNCICRKPRTGLLDLACRDLDFDIGTCFVIGDKASDIEMGQSAGAVTILVRTGYGAAVVKEGTCIPDHTVSGLLEASRIIQRLVIAQGGSA